MISFQRFRFDEPWDSPNNRALIEKMPFPYGSGPESRKGQTSYLGLAGTGAMFEGTVGVSREDVPDGVEKTLMVIEVEQKSVPWTKPEDLPVEKGKGLSVLGKRGSFAGLLVSGHVRWINDRGPNLIKMLTRNDGETVYPDLLRGGNSREPSPYEQAHSLDEDLAILRQQMVKDGLEDYLPLITRARFQAAIRAHLRIMDALSDTVSKADPAARAYLNSIKEAAKPIFGRIADEGIWPQGTKFSYFTLLRTGHGDIDGLWIRLKIEVKPANGDPTEYALPILDLSYGYAGG